ncbi:MAG: ankyrin repeat domain-containing protein [Gemmataceae bacterium]|nr:ankyrin repeat domain-containing protein [Gemmataceae bacterium]
MTDPVSRRTAITLSAGFVLGSAADLHADEPPKKVEPPKPNPGPVEAAFERDYPAPGFKPSWKNPQLNRLLVQDFVILAHSDLDMTKKLVEKYPAVLNGTMDWGNGDWESGLGGASHMGRHDIVEFLLEKGARIDIFCATMMGQLDAVRAFLTLQPKLIDATGPHGIFNLHFHAQLARDGGKVLDYLQSVKKVELKPNPFLKKPADAKKPG